MILPTVVGPYDGLSVFACLSWTMPHRKSFGFMTGFMSARSWSSRRKRSERYVGRFGALTFVGNVVA